MSEIVERIENAIATGRYAAVDDLWLELFESERIPAERLAPQVTRLVEAGQGARAVDLVLALAPELVREERCAEALPLLRAAAPAAEGNEDLRAALIDCFRHLYLDKPHVAAAIDRSGLLTDADIASAVAALDRLLSYEVGDYVYHASGWGVGAIRAFDPLDVTATIDFERKPGHIVPLDSLDTIFERLKPDDFRVLRRTDPEQLAAMAEEHPAALVRKVLAANDGRVTQRGLRDCLHGDIVPADAWSRWWTRARAELRRDPLVKMTGGSHPVLTLRAEALTYEDEMRARFDRVRDLVHQADIVRDYVRHRARDADPAAFLLPAAQAIAASIRAGAAPGPAFEAAVLLAELAVDAGDVPSPGDILRQQADPIPLLNGLSTDAARRQAMRLLQESSENKKRTCHDILLRGPAELWDTAVACLAEGEEPPTVQSLVDEVLADPKRNLDLFAWVARGLLLRRLEAQASPKRVFELLLTEGDEVARRKTHRRPSEGRFDEEETLASLRQAVRAGGLGYFDKMAREASEIEASRLLFRVRQSSLLTGQMASHLERAIVRRYPRLLVEEHKEAEAVGPEPVYATPEGIAKRRAEHDRLAHVAIPEIEKRIGEAAAMGDVSDNADFRTAIEERTHLTRRLREIADELARARPIERAMVHTDHVSIGSRVTLEDTETGEQTTYAILGPWDADAEHHVMSYTAPLARALMRQKVGDEVPLEHAGETATYRILAIESALAV